MRRINLALVQLLYFVTSICWAQDSPPIPYIDNGACPFECCIYRQWQAKEPGVAYVDPSVGTGQAFSISATEWVTAETGFVATKEFGITRILKPIRLGYPEDSEGTDQKPELELKPGELLYILHPAGEGYDVFWYHGKVYSDQITLDENNGPMDRSDLSIESVSRPVTEWWVRIKNSKGQVGWIQIPPYFDNADACG